MSKPNDLDRLHDHAKKAQVSELQAKTIMGHEIVTILHGTKIYAAVQTLAAKKISGAPVVDRGGRLVGVITEHDLLMQTATRDVIDPIEYTKDVIKVAPEATMLEMLALIHKKRIRWVPVVTGDQKVVGIVHRIDILNKLLSKGK
jgi:CBS domain-containing protein